MAQVSIPPHCHKQSLALLNSGLYIPRKNMQQKGRRWKKKRKPTEARWATNLQAADEMLII